MIDVKLKLTGGWQYGENERISVDVITTTDMHSQFLNGNYGSNIYRAGQYVKDIRNVINMSCYLIVEEV